MKCERKLYDSIGLISVEIGQGWSKVEVRLNGVWENSQHVYARRG